MGRPKKKDVLTIKQIESAIKATGGMLSEAAEMLGCSHQNICVRISKSDYLQEVMRGYERAFVKLAESQIIKGIREGNQSSSMFYLKCKGGYSEKRKEENDSKLTYEQILDIIDAVKSKSDK